MPAAMETARNVLVDTLILHSKYVVILMLHRDFLFDFVLFFCQNCCFNFSDMVFQRK